MMGRADDDRGGRNQSRPPARHDEMSRLVHQLSNALHSLVLRLFVLKASNLSTQDRGHVQEAHRLAEQSAALLADIRALRDGSDREDPPSRLTGQRQPR
jgi:hypothetical protein